MIEGILFTMGEPVERETLAMALELPAGVEIEIKL